MTEALRERRRRLIARVKNRPFLLAAGRARPRNYRNNTYPFRASSHFLWAAGAPIPGAFLGSDGRNCFLFVEESTLQDQVWHGPTPSVSEWSTRLGLEVRPMSQLESWVTSVGADRIMMIPPPDERGAQELQAVMGRALPAADDLDEKDLPLARALIELRLSGDEYSLRSMRGALSVTARAFAAGMRASRPAVTEAHVMGAMMGEILSHGMQAAYGPIVTVHGEVLHSESHQGRLAAGDLLLADVGAESEEGVATDVTRTWPVSGKFSPTQKAIYEVVLAAQEAALSVARPGVRYRDLHFAASKAMISGLMGLGILKGDPAELFQDGVHALFFPHGIGHLLGYDVHDMEDLGDLAGYDDGRLRSQQFGLSYLRLDRDLRPGMVVTVEPGFYAIPGLLAPESDLSRKAGDRLNRSELGKFSDVRGIRIEDDVLITDTGHEVLSAGIPKKPADLETILSRR